MNGYSNGRVEPLGQADPFDRADRFLVFRDGRSSVRPARATDRGLVRVDRGAYLDWPAVTRALGPDPAAWQVRKLVNLARLYSTSYRFREQGPIAFTGASALVAVDAGVWNRDPTVTFRGVNGGQSRRGLLPAVETPVTVVRSVPFRRLSGGLNRGKVATQRSHMQPELLTTDFVITAADLTRTQPPFEAFVDLCMLLASLNHFGNFESEQRAFLCSRLVEQVTYGLEGLEGGAGTRRLRRMLKHAHCGADSPGEAVLLWMVKCWWQEPQRVVAQQPVATPRGRYFLDVAIPHLKIGFEFDGATKLGNDESGWLRRSGAFLERQRNLLDAGWKLSRYTFQDTLDPALMMRKVGEALEGRPGARGEPGGPLWHPLK